MGSVTKKVHWQEHKMKELEETVAKLEAVMIPTESIEVHGRHLGVGNKVCRYRKRRKDSQTSCGRSSPTDLVQASEGTPISLSRNCRLIAYSIVVLVLRSYLGLTKYWLQGCPIRLFHFALFGAHTVSTSTTDVDKGSLAFSLLLLKL